MSAIGRAFNKIFGATSVGNVEVINKQAAPKLDEPTQEVKSPELGGQSQESIKKRRGKSSLKIESGLTRSNTGLNVA